MQSGAESNEDRQRAEPGGDGSWDVPIPSRMEMSRAVQTVTGTTPTAEVSVPGKGVKLTPAQVQAITRLGAGNEAEVRGTDDDGTALVVVGGRAYRISPEGRSSRRA